MHIIAQVLNGELLTPQVILAIIGFLGAVLGIPATIIGAWAINSRVKTKADADARVKDAEGRLKAVEAEAEAKKAEAETTKNLVAANQQLVDGLRAESTLRQKDKEQAERNYRVFTDVSNENARVIVGRIDARVSELMTAIQGIPERVSVANNDGITALVQQLGEVITKEFQLQRAERTMHPFPASEDRDWRDEYIIPTSEDVQLYKQPAFDDDARLHKPCATIRPEGERVRLISGRLNGWLIVDKSEGGERCWGWLPEYAVKAGQPESIPT